MRAPRLVGAALAAATVLLAAPLASPAAASETGIDIDHVEAAEDGTVSVLLGVDGLPGGAAPDLSGLTIKVGDQPVRATASTIKAGDLRRTTVLAIDASQSMRGSRIEAAQAAALAFLDAAPADVQVGLVTFSGRMHDVIAPTADHNSIAAAVEDIRLTRGTHVYDAIDRAAELTGSDGARSVLLLSDGRDTGGRTSLPDAVSAATEAGVVVDVVALDQGQREMELLGRVARASGGDVVASDERRLGAVFADQADALAHQVLVRFQRPDGIGKEAQVTVALAADGRTWTDSAYVSLGAFPSSSGPTAGVQMTAPRVGTMALVFGLAALGFGLAGLLAVVLTGRRGASRAQRRIAAYLGEMGPQGVVAGATPDSLKASAVAMTEKVVNGDFEARLKQRLSGAAVALSPAEWILLQAGITVAGGLVGFAMGGLFLMLLGLIAGIAGPMLYLKVRHSRRLRAFSAQLPETLTLMAGGLSAGLSLAQAVDTVVREGHEPMAGELRRALVEHRLGVELEDALDGVSDRMASKDFSWVVMAIRIQREVGGNLSEILHTVSDTLREREFLRRQVRSLSAEGRLSAWILGVLPVAMFGYLLVANRDFIRPLYTQFLGALFLGAAVLLLALGAFVMSRLVKVEI